MMTSRRYRPNFFFRKLFLPARGAIFFGVFLFVCWPIFSTAQSSLPCEKVWKKRNWYNIPPQTIDKALKQYTETIKQTFIFSSDIFQQKKTKRVRGYFTAKGAAERLLKNTQWRLVCRNHKLELVKHLQKEKPKRPKFLNIPDEIEETTVYGERSSIKESIKDKRESDPIIDPIKPIDIGKLPDKTIADAVQRVPGVQIQRSAAEGNTVNVRGLNYVHTTLNGESFFPSASIITIQPDYRDIPSQLLAGVTVIKSPTAATLPGGAGATINLETYRPFMFSKNKVTSMMSAELHDIENNHETTPMLNGLLSWRNKNWGWLGAISYQELAIPSSYFGFDSSPLLPNATTIESSQLTSPLSHEVYTPATSQVAANITNLLTHNAQGVPHTLPFYLTHYPTNSSNIARIRFPGHKVSNRLAERQRLGLTIALEIKPSKSVALLFETFFTQMEENIGEQGIFLDFIPSADTPSTDNPRNVTVRQLQNAPNDYNEALVTSSYDVSGLLGSASMYNFVDAESRHSNFELRYDARDNFDMTFRAVTSQTTQRREHSYLDSVVLNNTQQTAIQSFISNPQKETLENIIFPDFKINYSQGTPHWLGLNEDDLSNSNNYLVSDVNSINNLDSKTTSNVLRIDSTYTFKDDALLIKSGLRWSQRDIRNRHYDLYVPTPWHKCLTKSKSPFAWVKLDENRLCSASLLTELVKDPTTIGSGTWEPAGKFFPFTSNEIDANWVTKIRLNGAASIPPIYSISPQAMQELRNFQNTFYPGHNTEDYPWLSYGIRFTNAQAYFLLSWQYDSLSGSLGARYIHEKRRIKQNVILPDQARGILDRGTPRLVEISPKEFLPSAYLRYKFKDSEQETLLLRAAFSHTLSSIHTHHLGGGFVPRMERYRESDTASLLNAAVGNPTLDFIKARNFDLSFEYYRGERNLMGVGLFNITIINPLQSGTAIWPKSDFDDIIDDVDSLNTNLHDCPLHENQDDFCVGTLVQGSDVMAYGAEFYLKQDLPIIESLRNHFGIDANYTLVLNDTNKEDIEGKTVSITDNSTHQANLSLWYEDHLITARVGVNYRSDRTVAYLGGKKDNIILKQSPATYVDASFAYHLGEDFTIYFNANNITEESEHYYFQFKDNFAWQYNSEAQYAAGIRFRMGY